MRKVTPNSFSSYKIYLNYQISSIISKIIFDPYLCLMFIYSSIDPFRLIIWGTMSGKTYIQLSGVGVVRRMQNSEYINIFNSGV